jgi:biofilm PGA synthesis N-glycosyltransferase PgaC
MPSIKSTSEQIDQSFRYVIITPVRDEEDHLRTTIENVAAQTALPLEWVIVDDGSSDGTGDLIDEYARRLPWIRVIHRSNRGFRKSGSGVVEAFYDGYNSLEHDDSEFVVKLDGDLSFGPDYFEKCLEQFHNDPHLGIGGGSVYHVIDGKMEFEQGPRFHVRGATKIYRRACWQAIGGIQQAAGWDTIDEVKANMLGWTTRSFSNVPMTHSRMTGAADGAWKDRVKHGLACYISGYHPLFVVLSCAYRLFRKPYITGAVAMFFGFAKGYLLNISRMNDKSYCKYIRQQQLKRLFGGQTIWR